ncbi:hypothetical protein [Cellulomonas denverensis]|uniref:Uncharacterized protein n=1 Tax=Cellulomonas denverensis TaxID=264297 RepID=A0A7X6KSB8_9CELL|nr:hypothetical protein [Cellulomonas denverensis]NKY21372.1 hypothetical protein [Cellulomonas denverensis]
MSSITRAYSSSATCALVTTDRAYSSRLSAYHWSTNPTAAAPATTVNPLKTKVVPDSARCTAERTHPGVCGNRSSATANPARNALSSSIAPANAWAILASNFACAAMSVSTASAASPA